MNIELLSNFVGYEVDHEITMEFLNNITDRIDDILFENVGNFGYFDECLYSNDFDTKSQAVSEFLEWYKDVK